MNDNNKHFSLLVLGIVLLLGFSAGFAVGWMSNSGGNFMGLVGGADQKYFNLGFQKAREKLEEAMPEVKSAFFLSGRVDEIKDGKIYFIAAKVHPLQDEKFQNRIAVVNDKTLLSVYLSQEPTMERKAEINASLKELSSARKRLKEEVAVCFSLGNDCSELNSKITAAEKEIDILEEELKGYVIIKNASLTDIKPGFIVSISSENGVDIAEAESFTAGKITARGPVDNLK